MNPNAKDEFVQLPISTRDGTFIARYSAKGLASLNFPSDRNGRADLSASAPGFGATAPKQIEGGRVGRDAQQRVPATIRRWHRATTAALKRALAGRAPQILPPFDVSGGTEFQRRVWSAMRKIACGNTQSYGEIARSIRHPKAVRAVGGACGANPIPVLVPCHRVLAANRKIGGFSGGLSWKRTLLKREGVRLG